MKPPGWMEWTVARLLPKDRRETVLGDLEERYTSPLAYCADAFTSVPAAILGQIRREMPLPFRLLEALLVFAGMWLAFAWGAAEDAQSSFQKSAAGPFRFARPLRLEQSSTFSARHGRRHGLVEERHWEVAEIEKARFNSVSLSKLLENPLSRLFREPTLACAADDYGNCHIVLFALSQ
jgi:hypothetical protein